MRILVLLAFVLAAFTPTSARARSDRPGNFDYYVLSLSWSPTYCASRKGARDRAQCGSKRRYAFVVHGLWPQYKHGWPQYCRTNQKWLPNTEISRMLDIMPSKRLIIHEWKKHGTCSNLGQRGYFRLTRKLYEKILTPARYVAPSRTLFITPEKLIHDFLSTNRGLSHQALSVQCGNSRRRARLSELRVCFSKDGSFTACGANERRRCRAETLVMPPVR